MTTTTHCETLQQLRPLGRRGMALVVIVLAAYLALVAHVAWHSSTAPEADCVYCSFCDRPVATPTVAVRITAMADARPVAPAARRPFSTTGRCPML